MAKTVNFDHYKVFTHEDGSLFELGQGAMGITYKAFDTNLRVNVALKVVNARYLKSDMAQQRFIREARSAAQLRHPNVASVYHLGTSDDAYFYAMEFVDGETLESLVKRQGALDPALALKFTIQVTRALSAATKHQLVHRDIKPANLMLLKEDDDYVVKVIDFGLAKSIKRDESEDLATLSMGGFVGTAHFASPEQLEEKELDSRSDIYSLGITLWYMLVGHAPFGGSIAQVMSQHLSRPPPVEQLEKVPADLRTVLLRMIEKDPAQRPQTPAALRVELENCLAHLGSAASSAPVVIEKVVVEKPKPVVEKIEKPKPPPAPVEPLRLNFYAIAGGGLIVLAVALFLFFKLRSHENAPAVETQAIAATATPTSTAAAITPTPPTPERAAVLKKAVAEGQELESAQKWPQAVAKYVQIDKEFPESDVGKVRLELLLNQLESGPAGFDDKKFDEMRVPITEAAKLDVAAAMEILGNHLRRQDPVASFNWLCAAAAHGRAGAMREVGLRYSNGAGVERDLVKAAQWFDLARQYGDISAKTLLGECYLYGKGVTKNEARAAALLKDAAGANDPRAMDLLADCYHKGIGVPHDDKEAYRLFSQAAKLGYGDSFGNLGVLYLNSEETDLGKNKKARAERAFSLFGEGVKQNNPFCMFLYAKCLESGTGVNVDLKAAESFYRRAAEAGNVAARNWCHEHKVTLSTEEEPP
jgi:TPR repeat protein/tRNA A-37 threonylcarbamoyl transferase component Bud32